MPKIYVRLMNGAHKLELIDKGDWIDLRANEDVELEGPTKVKASQEVNLAMKLIPLGIAMKLPDGYEAVMNSRSSSPSKLGIIMANSQGVIDQTYCGNDDEWKFSAIAIKKVSIPKGTRICQFRIQLSQKASVWQKLKWLFSSGKFKFVYVDELPNPNRGGIGSTGSK